MKHSFDVKVAQELGVNKAILLNYIDYWVRKNKANRHNLHDGYYYTYNSYEAFAEMFPYIGIATIKRCMIDLEKRGLIMTAQLSENKWDKTKYYTLHKDYYQWLNQLTIDESNSNPSMGNERSDDIQLVPVSTQKKVNQKGLPPQSSKDKKDELSAEVITLFNDIVGTKSKPTKPRISAINGRRDDGAHWEDFMAVILMKWIEWSKNSDMKKYLTIDTLTRPKHFQKYREQFDLEMPDIIEDFKRGKMPYDHPYSVDLMKKIRYYFEQVQIISNSRASDLI
jgi:uncharacterized phage protein (TIGR02220 family)